MLQLIRPRRMARATAVLGTVLGAVFVTSQAAIGAPLLVATQQVSSDPYTNTSSFHQTQLEPDTFSFGSTTVAVFQTGRFSNGGANDIGYATTTNNGASWSNGFMPGTTVYSQPPGTWARISDPSVAYDPKHDVWIASGLAIDNSATGKAVLVNRSTNGGLTFQNPVTVSTGGGSSFYDKEWITCDTWPNSPNFGNCYVEWDDAGLGQILKMSRSTDGGLTWSPSTVPSASVIGGQPVVQPNGTVVVPIGGGAGLESFVSTNGGMSYTGPFAISNIQDHAPAGNLRAEAELPSADVDAAGKIYVAWYDCRFRASCQENDIVFSTSTNGTTWTAPVRIPIDLVSSSADHFIPGIGLDHTTSGASAHIGVTYYFYPNTSCTTSTCKLGAAYISSTNGGSTWGTPKLLLKRMGLTWLPLTTLGYMVGDYVSTSFGDNGRAYPVIAKATQGTCQVGQITSCHEFMVAPVAGLPILGGTRPVGTHPVTTIGEHRAAGIRTAY